MATDTSRERAEEFNKFRKRQKRQRVLSDKASFETGWQAAERLTRERIAAAIEEKYSGGNCGAVVWRMVDIYDGLDWLAEEIRRADL